MEDRRRQLARDLEHVGQHEQQALGRGKRRRQRARLQRAVHRASGAALALHFLHDGDVSPDIAKPREAHSSARSAIVEDGVIGKIAQTSFTR